MLGEELRAWDVNQVPADGVYTLLAGTGESVKDPEQMWDMVRGADSGR